MPMNSRLACASLLLLCVAITETTRAQTGIDSTTSTRRLLRGTTASPQAQVDRIAAGASAYVIDSIEIMASAGENLSAVLAARVPGLSVLRPGGSAAEGSRVRLRGPHSLLMTTEPIVIVDGIRVNAMQEASVVDVGVRTSRLDDIEPADIARIDVLPGAAAASLFGPGAAAGALVITTKRGAPGAWRWSGRAESRLGMKPSGFPANYHRTGTETSTGQPTPFCDLLRVASGACTPTGLEVWNPLEQASPFHMQKAVAGNVSLAGGIGQTSTRMSATGRRTSGVIGSDDVDRLGLRATAARTFASVVDVDVHGGYTRTSAGLPLAGLGAGIISAGLFGGATDDAMHGYSTPLSSNKTRQRANHWNAGATAAWKATPWLTATAVYGRDDLDQRDNTHTVINIIPSGTAEFRRWGGMTHTMTTTGAALTASYGPTASRPLGGETSVGYDRLGSALTVTDSQQFSWSESRRRWTFSGPWLRQQLAWRDRLLVGASVREERAKEFGDKSSVWRKSADASWKFGDVGPLDAVRLHAAYGEGGNWMAGNPSIFSTANGLFTDASAAEPVERTAELEAGIEAGFGKRTHLSLTAFRSDGSKLYVLGVSPPSTGFPPLTAAFPEGRMRNEGVELAANARVLEGSSLQWDVDVSVATLRNRVRSLGNVPPVVTANGRTAVGYPLGGYWRRPYTYDDTNGDGIIGATEVHFTSDTGVFAGPSLPTREAALNSTLSLGNQLRAGVQLDYRGGQKLSNANERLRCRSFLNCRGAQDPSAPLEEQARYAISRDPSSPANDQYIEDASFLKLRELSLTWSVPSRWSSRVTRTGFAVTLAGRNLVTWTSYSGLDPELDIQRFDQPPRAELAKFPPVREVVLRLDIGVGAVRRP